MHRIDMQYLQDKDISFAQALGSNANSVAQYVASAMSHWSILCNKPLNQLSIGIIGYGNVGKKVRMVCQKLGLKCVINDPPLADGGMKYEDVVFESLDAALNCDVVSLHVPLTLCGKYTTRYLINAQQIKQMRPNTLIINAARGGVVNETAMLVRKQEHKDIDFILDVWENEPDINFQVLQQATIATPHIAGYSYDGKLLGTQMIYQACCDYKKAAPQWSIADVDCSIEPKRIGKNYSREAILKAYNIQEDDKQLRKIILQTTHNRKSYFDALRKNYPIRREWY
jgi:erythronate-4-phosphate dehydrogenase